MAEIFEECPNDNCYDGQIWHYGKHDAWRKGECPDCGGTGMIVIADKEKEAMLTFIMEIASTPINFVNENKPIARVALKAQRLLKQLPGTYLKEVVE